MQRSITEATRRSVFDYLSTCDIHWAGRLGDAEFLSRLYDLTGIASNDHRFADAEGDIVQHRQNWMDWPDDWVLWDTRFNLLRGSDEEFLSFLCETIHPVVGQDEKAVDALLHEYTRLLAADGWTLVVSDQLSGKAIYGPQHVGQRVGVFEEPTGWEKVDRQAQAVRDRLHAASTEEQFQTIGLLCREVIISACQEVYDEARHPPDGDVRPSSTDAKRMLDAVLNVELPGQSNQESRAHAKAAVRLALALQHKRTADFRMAALCAEAATSVVNILAILFDRRGPIVPRRRSDSAAAKTPKLRAMAKDDADDFDDDIQF